VVTVFNTHGGTNVASDFSVGATNNGADVPPPPGQTAFHAGADGSVVIPLDPGTFGASLHDFPGYTGGFQGDCGGTIGPNQVKTCNIGFFDM
jgi:hypothetical protein